MKHTHNYLRNPLVRSAVAKRELEIHRKYQRFSKDPQAPRTSWTYDELIEEMATRNVALEIEFALRSAQQ